MGVFTMWAARMHTLLQQARKCDPGPRSAGRRPRFIRCPPEAGLGDPQKDIWLLKNFGSIKVMYSDISTRKLHSRIVGRIVNCHLYPSVHEDMATA